MFKRILAAVDATAESPGARTENFRLSTDQTRATR